MDKEPEFTQDWTSSRFKMWREVLAPFIGREQVRALELGSFEGRSALFFLGEIVTHATAKLICVDKWWDKEVYGRFLCNLVASGQQDRCEIRRGDTHQVLRSMRQRFEIIYVDADHSSPAVLTDAVLAWPLLQTDGIIIFDDYEWLKPDKTAGPKAGIDAFLQVFEGQYELLHKGWQVILRKK